MNLRPGLLTLVGEEPCVDVGAVSWDASTSLLEPNDAVGETSSSSVIRLALKEPAARRVLRSQDSSSSTGSSHRSMSAPVGSR